MKIILKFWVVFFVIASISIWARPPKRHGQSRKPKGERHAACKEDISKLCSTVKPGEGRMRDCLKENKDKLSEECKKSHNF